VISDIPSIPGVPPQLLQVLNDRLRTLSGQLDNAQATIAAQITATNKTIDNLPGSPVESVNGKTGTVTLTASDVAATPTAGSYMQSTTTVAPSGKHFNSITFDAYGRLTGLGSS